MDEGHRRFHSGRFGPTTEMQDFNMKDNGKTSGKQRQIKSKGKDEAGNTYKDQATADEFDSQNKFMRD